MVSFLKQVFDASNQCSQEISFIRIALFVIMRTLCDKEFPIKRVCKVIIISLKELNKDKLLIK